MEGEDYRGKQTTWVTYYCDCEGAKLDAEIERLKKELDLIKKRNVFVNKVRYNDELEELNDKYKEYLKVIKQPASEEE